MNLRIKQLLLILSLSTSCLLGMEQEPSQKLTSASICVQLGDNFYFGLSKEVDIPKAIDFYKRALEDNNDLVNKFFALNMLHTLTFNTINFSPIQVNYYQNEAYKLITTLDRNLIVDYFKKRLYNILKIDSQIKHLFEELITDCSQCFYASNDLLYTTIKGRENIFSALQKKEILTPEKISNYKLTNVIGFSTQRNKIAEKLFSRWSQIHQKMNVESLKNNLKKGAPNVLPTSKNFGNLLKNVLQFQKLPTIQNEMFEKQYIQLLIELGKAHYFQNFSESQIHTAVVYFEHALQESQEHAYIDTQAEAEKFLGYVYLYNTNHADRPKISLNFKKATGYLTSIKKRENPKITSHAELALGEIQMKGLGVQKNLKKASDIFENIIEMNADKNSVTKAHMALGYCYAKSDQFLKSNAQEAVKNFSKVMDNKKLLKHKAYACYCLGNLYMRNNPNVPQDLNKARFYFDHASLYKYSKIQEKVTRKIAKIDAYLDWQNKKTSAFLHEVD